MGLGELHAGEDLWILTGRTEGLVSLGGGGEGWQLLGGKRRLGKEKKKFLSVDPYFLPQSLEHYWTVPLSFSLFLLRNTWLSFPCGSQTPIFPLLFICTRLFHLADRLQRLRMIIILKDTFGQKTGDRAWPVSAGISAANGNSNKIPTSSPCAPV